MDLSNARYLSIIRFVATYYTATRAMIQSECLPGTDPDGRVARKILNKLKHEGLLNQTRGEVVFTDRNGAPAPVYYPSRKGCELLACELRDDRWLQTCCLTPNWQHLTHWLAIAQFHAQLDKAIRLQADVQVDRWLSEWDVANPSEHDPAKRYCLFTEIRRQPRLVFAPDAGWLLAYRGYKKVYYLELDRSTSGIQQIANSKTPGVAGMGMLHRRHFPETNIDAFSVLLVAQTPNRRDALRRAILPKDGSHLWRFVAWTDVKPETLLFEPIIYRCEGDAIPLVKRTEEVTA